MVTLGGKEEKKGTEETVRRDDDAEKIGEEEKESV